MDGYWILLIVVFAYIDMDMIMSVFISYSTCKTLINNNNNDGIGSMICSIAPGKLASMTIKIVQHSVWMTKKPTIFDNKPFLPVYIYMLVCSCRHYKKILNSYLSVSGCKNHSLLYVPELGL